MNPRKPRLVPRVKPVSADYIATVRGLDERRLEVGISQLVLEARAGLQPGYWAHCLAPNTRNGRVAGREILDKVARVLSQPPAGHGLQSASTRGVRQRALHD